MTDIDSLINAVILREIVGQTAYSNDPHDPGGETCWGISAATARAFGYPGSMAALPRATAVEIYRKRYWLLPQLDRVDAIAPTIATKLFDVGVNLGQAIGVTLLQRALNALREEGSTALYPALKADGTIGPMTLYALQLFLSARADPGRQVLLFLLRAQQAVLYLERAEANVALLEYVFGWEQARAML